MGRSRRLLVKGTLALIALSAGTYVIVQLERDRPRMLLERAGVEMGTDHDGRPWMVLFPRGAARDELLLQVARLDTVKTIVLNGGEVSPHGLRALTSLRDLRVFDLSRSAGTPECLAAVGQLLSLRDLRLEGCAWVTDDGLRHLQTLHALEFLDLSGTAVSDAGLLSLSHLPRLNSLSLRDCSAVTDRALEQLATMPPLRSVTCTGAKISRRGVRAFLRTRPEADVITIALDVSDLKPLVDAGAEITLDTRFEVSTIQWDGSRSAGSVQWPLRGELSLVPDSASVEQLHRSAAPFDEAIDLLADCPAMHNLSIRNIPLTDAALAPLEEVSALNYVVLDNCPIRGAGLRHLQSHRNLSHLDVSSPVLTDEAFRQIGGLSHLTWLSIACRQRGAAETDTGKASITDEDLGHLQDLLDLRYLDLVGLPLTGAGLEHLERLSNLWSLTLELERWDPESLRHVSRLPALVKLSVAGAVTADGIRHLSSAPSLIQLNLHDADLDESCARELASLPRLRNLDLIDVRLSGEALRAFPASSALKCLRLFRTDCPEEAIEQLRRDWPEFEMTVEEPP
jgi:hypothetical protein